HGRQGDARPGRRAVAVVAAAGWIGMGAAIGVTAWVGYGWGAQCALPLLAVRRGARGGGRVALTFDDGPDPEATPRLLDLLNAAGLQAARTFGLTTVLWSLQPEGLRPRSPAEQLRYCRRRLHDGAILDLHDAPGLPGAPERLLGLVPGLLALLAERGLSAVP